MAITAIALVRIPSCAPNAQPPVRVEPLADAVLLHTEASFGSAPDELVALVASSLGPQLGLHSDPRGMFFLPSVASPKARTYDALIAEIGEGGMWAALPSDAADAFAMPEGLGALGAMLGNMMQQMPPSLLDAASAAARGDMSSLSLVGDELAARLGQTPPAAVDMASLGKLVADSGIDLSSPVFQQMLAGLQETLARDPDAVTRLAEQLFGRAPGDEPDEKK
jgi:hypothetical protein